LVKKGTNLDFGARPLRRAIETFIEDPLAEELLKGEFAGKNTVKVEVKKVGDKKQLVFNGHAAGAPVDMSPPPGEPVGAGASGGGAAPSGPETASS
jgi:ATP-dependent Clp protease ATP-binding subunit ClpC